MEFLIDMAWKSTIIAGVGLAVMAAMTGAAARDRVWIGALAMALLVVLPVACRVLPILEIEPPAILTAEAEEVVAAGNEAVEAVTTRLGSLEDQPLVYAGVGETEPAPVTEPMPVIDPLPVAEEESVVETAAPLDIDGMLAIAYALPVIGLLLYLAFGLIGLANWKANAETVANESWRSALERTRARLDMRRPVRLLKSDVPTAPISFGWLRPSVMLDADALARPEDADAVLGHEVAHLKNRDWPILVMTRIVRALFWFNPLVWLLARQLDDRLEEAADELAVQGMPRTEYAQALLNAARREYAPYPVNAATASKLERRILRLLGGKTGRRSAAKLGGAAAICAGIAVPVTALQFVEAPVAPAEPETPVVAEAPFDLPEITKPKMERPDFRIERVKPRVRAPRIEVAAWQDERSNPAPRVSRAYWQDQRPTRAPRDSEWQRELATELAEMRRELAEMEREIEEETAQTIAEVERDLERSRRQMRHDLDNAAKDMENGARDMLRGSYEMEEGARQMDSEAEKLRHREYREKVIAENRARGSVVTHQELIDSIPEMKRGADEMRQGAAEMRKGAKEMNEEARRMREKNWSDEG